MAKLTKPLALILEDVAEVREWVRSLLETRFPEWQFRAVDTPSAFRRALERERPTLVILDEVLGPGEDLASLLSVARLMGLPIALMTGVEPGHRKAGSLPADVMQRINKPNWETGEGTEGFLRAVGEVIALTTSSKIG